MMGKDREITSVLKAGVWKKRKIGEFRLSSTIV